MLASGQRIYLLSQSGEQAAIPDLRGQSLRDALEVLNLLKVGITVEGEGYVTEQSEANQNGKKVVTLKLNPLNEYGEDIPVAAAGDTAGDDSGDGTTE
ncbi:hypothetical protein D3C73_1153180 [compost metagenome]